jgi:ribosome recycling factor
MEKVVNFFQEQIRFIRLGTVTSALIETIKVSCYTSLVPIKNIAQCFKTANSVTIQPYDLQLVSAICIALKAAGLDAYLSSKGCVTVNIPLPTGEERERVKKHIAKLAEEAKVAIRQIRKKLKTKIDADKLQEETDRAINQIERLVEDKCL